MLSTLAQFSFFHLIIDITIIVYLGCIVLTIVDRDTVVHIPVAYSCVYYFLFGNYRHGYVGNL